jgi:TRAP-type transport system periplasmic protein
MVRPALRLGCLVFVVGVVAVAATARAGEPEHTLRMASIVPQGTAWAREMHALSRDVALQTSGRVNIKWYLGGIAGDDVEAGKRVERDQLDGVGTGAWQCERWAPSIKVTRLPGLFANRAESKYVASRLRPTFEEEFKRAGFVYLGDSQVGPSIVLTRRPVRSFDELKHTKLWTLDVDPTKARLLGALGMTVVPLSFDESRRAFDDGRVDGFLAPPTGALAFQWATQARYFTDVTTDHILGCIVVTARAFDRLPFEDQRTVRAAAAKFAARFDDVGAHADEELLGGLFERQGLQRVRVDDRFRAEFDAASRAVWDQLDEKMVPRALLQQVRAILAAYRAANPTR